MSVTLRLWDGRKLQQGPRLGNDYGAPIYVVPFVPGLDLRPQRFEVCPPPKAPATEPRNTERFVRCHLVRSCDPQGVAVYRGQCSCRGRAGVTLVKARASNLHLLWQLGAPPLFVCGVSRRLDAPAGPGLARVWGEATAV